MELTIYQDYTIKGFHKKTTFNSLGDVYQTGYYLNFDSEEGIFSNLQVLETRTITRDQNGLPTKRDLNIKFYKITTVVFEKNYEKYFVDYQIALQKNKDSSARLIDKAGVYLMSSLGIENAKTIQTEFALEMSMYVEQNRDPLLTGIQNSTNPLLTAETKLGLKTILDVDFTQDPINPESMEL
jgi:hypothetical protein